jgi:DNA-binding transcriptional MerR regulator
MPQRHMVIPEYGDFTVMRLLASAYVGEPIPKETMRHWRKKFHIVPDVVVSQREQLYDARTLAIMLLLARHMRDGFHMREFDSAYNLGVLEDRINRLVRFGFRYESIDQE